MWWIAGLVAVVGFLAVRRKPSIFRTLPDGTFIFDYATLGEEGEIINNTILSYGRIGEGKLDDGTLWVEGEYGAANATQPNIYQRAVQLGGPTSSEFRWVVIHREALDLIAADKSPRYVKLFIVDPHFARETGMTGPDGLFARYA